MTTQTVGSAVAVKKKSDQLVSWLRSQQEELAMAAASHLKPSTIVRVTQGALRKDAKLMAAAVANPLSLLHCLLDAARLGHEPATDQYYLVPFGSEVTGIEGYKGIIERMFRAGGVSSVVAQVVRQRDSYTSRGENTPPVHDYDDFADPKSRGELRGAYAYAIYSDGRCSQVIRMGRAEIMEHKAKSRGSDKPDSPWQQWPAAMWKKTVLRALEPYVPTSSEWLFARAQAAHQAANGEPAVFHRIVNGPGVPSDAAEPVDAEIVEEPEPQPEPERRRQPGKRELAARQKLHSLLRQLPLGTPADAQDVVSFFAGTQVTDLNQLTVEQAGAVTTALEEALTAAKGDAQDAADRVWRVVQAGWEQGTGDGGDAAPGPEDGGQDG